MNLVNCYRLLGLRTGAKIDEIKASYRHLARKYHPDVNLGNPEAHTHFILLTEAYQMLVNVLEKKKNELEDSQQGETAAKVIKVTEEKPVTQSLAELSAYDQKLKWNCYETLHQLLKERKFARAIALVEGLAQRVPQDLEVRQWQAITYQQWGKTLLQQKQLDKAKNYFKKALKTDPHNRSLWQQVKQDLERIQRMF